MSSSCSSSSNIMSSITSVNLNSIGSRILAQIPLVSSDYSFEEGITAGDVIRYDVSDESAKQYKTSLANNAENAEVVGVVESIDDDTMNVVIFGQINFPSDKFVDNTPAGTIDGASGGNDIFFLSPSVTGGVQNIAPFQPTEVVKPVLQKMDDGTNNAVVLNYIGYSIGGEVASTNDTDTSLGEILTVMNTDSLVTPPNYINVSNGSQYLKTTEYPEAFSYFGTQFGYTEEIEINGNRLTQSLIGQQAIQKDGRSQTYSARITGVDVGANTITVNRNSGQSQADTGKTINVDGNDYSVTKRTITRFVIPRIVPTTQYRFDVDGSATEVETVTLLKVKNTIGVTIPRKITVTDLEVTNKLTTNTASADTLDDINSTVNSINTEVSNIKTTLGLS